MIILPRQARDKHGKTKKVPISCRLRWGEEADIQSTQCGGGAFDLVLGADILYNKSSYKVLADTIAALVGKRVFGTILC